MKGPGKLSSVTRTQELMLRATRIAQQTVKYASFGRLKPHWVLPLAGHFCSRNKNKENSETGDSEPGLPSHRWHKEKRIMIASRYKRRALILT
jgi:hypothetical protein